MTGLLENPLLRWTLERSRRDNRFLLGLLLFLGLLYGAAAVAFLIWFSQPVWRRELVDLFTAIHYVGWSGNGLMLLVITPARLAQKVARDRELGGLEQLRLTGLSGQDLAVGELASVSLLPLLGLLLSGPLVLLGLGGEGGPLAVGRGYLALLLCAPAYAMAGGLVGLGAKKAQNAGASAIFSTLLLLGVSSIGVFPAEVDPRPLALLGPWGGGMATVSERLAFSLPIAGTLLPGELVMVPVLLLLSRALLTSFARRLSGEPGVGPGLEGALALVLAVGVVGALTLPRVKVSGWGDWRARLMPADAAVVARLIALWLASLLVALETPVGWRELTRGLARREPDDPVRPEESFGPWRWWLGPGALVGAGVLLLPAAAVCDPSPSLPGVVTGLLVALAAWFTAALAFQAALLFWRDQGNPRALAGLGLVALWLGPVLAGAMIRQVGARDISVLSFAVNPLSGLYWAGMAESASSSGPAPLALALVCLVVHGGAAWALWHLLGSLRQRAQEFADSMVALPADAYGAPGTLTRRCAAGHLYSEEWASCPHCPPPGPPGQGDATEPALRLGQAPTRPTRPPASL